MKRFASGLLALASGLLILTGLSGRTVGQQAEYPNPYANIPVYELTPDQKSYILEVEWAKARGLPPPPLPEDGKERIAPAPKFEDDTAKKGDFPPLRSSVLVLSFQGKNPIKQGTGFVVDKANKLVISSQHLIGTSDEMELIFPDSRDGKLITERDYYAKSRRFVKGKVIHRDRKRDLVVIEAPTMPKDVSELKTADKPLSFNERVHLIGNAVDGSSLWVYDTGRVRRADTRTIRLENGEVLTSPIVEVTTDVPLKRGDRGGPLVNDRGELVAIEADVKSTGPLTRVAIAASELKNTLADAYRQHMAKLMADKQYAKAVDFGTKAIEFNPKDPVALVERGAAYSYQDQYDKAIEDYTAAIKLDPKFARAYRSRGSAYFYQRKFDKTIEDCTKAIELNPKYALAYLTRSKAYGKSNRAKQAKEDYDQAIKLDPKLKE